ncbi:MAG: hypothetical protein C5B50_30020 [Verrucomicrobia bacterium]|nr:MAG: hypothetical protein C5B50_30020 [Verrucomicrobiota bacterium]
MNEKSFMPGLGGAVALVALATGLTFQHQTHLKLREEQKALHQHLDRVTDLLAENERQASLLATVSLAPFPASDPSAELLRLRAEFRVLDQLTNELESARSENTQAHAALDRYLAGETAPQPVATADFWPRDSWSFAGFGSPDDALRSSIWASHNGNLKAVFDSTTGEFRQMIEKDLEGKSADEAAIRAMDEVGNVKSVHVLSRDFQSDDTAVITAEFDKGDQTNTTKFLLKKVGNQWKLAGMD